MSTVANNAVTNLIITGVGGQGNVLAARLLAVVLLEEGFEVSVGDVFGLAQRGGSVASHVRWTKERELPPLVPIQSLHILLAFEPLEALRLLTAYGNTETLAIVNNATVMPIGVQAGRFSYPELDQLWQAIRALTKKMLLVTGTELAREVGQIQALNMVMLGALAGSGFTELGKDKFRSVIKSDTPARHLEKNLLAFERGFQQGVAGDGSLLS
jgi:indolepyruvate ferredoxin oxidoreductase, beta subunit